MYNKGVLHKDKPSGLLVTNVVSREIGLRRQIDGSPVWGDAGVFAKCGNEGKLAYLSATWRAVKPDKDCHVPDVTEFISRIKSGDAKSAKSALPSGRLLLDFFRAMEFAPLRKLSGESALRLMTPTEQEIELR